MPLNVVLTNVTTAIIYRLKAETVTLRYEKAPIHIALPESNPVLFDLGQFRPSIHIEGILDRVATTDEGVIVPSKNNIEDAVRNWSANTITIAYDGNTYTAKFTGFVAVLNAAKEDFYDFVLQFANLGRT